MCNNQIKEETSEDLVKRSSPVAEKKEGKRKTKTEEKDKLEQNKKSEKKGTVKMEEKVTGNIKEEQTEKGSVGSGNDEELGEEEMECEEEGEETPTAGETLA